jgi:hypothetical protein
MLPWSSGIPRVAKTPDTHSHRARATTSEHNLLFVAELAFAPCFLSCDVIYIYGPDDLTRAVDCTYLVL